MEISELVRTQPSDLELALGRQIELRTHGRIRPLSVDVRPDRIVVGGTAPSYYLKQLALEAVLDVTRTRGPLLVAMKIRVGPDTSALAASDAE